MSKKRPTFPMKVPAGSVTVKIYRVQNKGGIRFTVSYFSNGRRSLKMFTDFEEAKTHARNVAKALDSGKVDVVELRGHARAAYLHTLELLAPTGIALEFAAADFVEAWRLLGGKASVVEAAREFVKRHLLELPDKMLPEAVKAMLADKERDGASKAYMKVLRFYLGQLADAFNCQVRAVTSSQLGEYLRGMEVSARSKNNARQTIGAFFKYCRESGWLPKDHDGIALVPKFKGKEKGIEIFTPLEIAHFLRFARPEMVPFLAIGAFAGLRSAEIERLDWAEVRQADRFIEVKASKAKTASRRLVPVSDNLAKWLAPYAQTDGRVVPFDNVPKQIGWLVEDTNAGLKADAEEAGGKFKPAKWKKNALRHSFISYRVADTQNVAQVALEAGNSPAIIFAHYRELVRPAEAKKWFAIEPGPEEKRHKTEASDRPAEAANVIVLPKAAAG